VGPNDFGRRAGDGGDKTGPGEGAPGFEDFQASTGLRQYDIEKS